MGQTFGVRFRVSANSFADRVLWPFDRAVALSLRWLAPFRISRFQCVKPVGNTCLQNAKAATRQCAPPQTHTHPLSLKKGLFRTHESNKTATNIENGAPPLEIVELLLPK